MSNPFNLQQAMAGSPVITKSGKPATILYFDYNSGVHGEKTMVVVTQNAYGNDLLSVYSRDGKKWDFGNDDSEDLVMVPALIKKFINIYAPSTPGDFGGTPNNKYTAEVFDTSAEADRHHRGDKRVACIPAEWRSK